MLLVFFIAGAVLLLVLSGSLIAMLQIAAIDEGDAAPDPPVINTRLALRLIRKKGCGRAICAAVSQKGLLIDHAPRGA